MVHIISTKALLDFCIRHAQYIEGVKAWITIVESSNWEKPADIIETFGPKAIDLLGKKNNKVGTLSSKRVVFDIKGNNIRVIAKYQFHEKLTSPRLYIKWIGTHAEYTKLCSSNSQFDIDLFG